LYANWGKVFEKVLPPMPVVVSNGADDSSSKLLEYSLKVWSEVRNDGGAGPVVFEATVFQDGKQWTKTAMHDLQAKQTAHFELVFDEVTLLGSSDKYTVRAYPLGTPPP